VYATSSMNPVENEAVVASLLEEAAGEGRIHKIHWFYQF